MIMAASWLKNKYLAKNITGQLLMLFMLLATSVAPTITTNSSATALGPATPTTLPSPQFPTLSVLLAWGHNTKYSTILLDENIIVKGSSMLDVNYPKNTDWNDDDYTIIGIYSFASDKLDSAVGNILAEDLSVQLIEGGIGHNFTTVRFISKALNDVEYNLKIFGVNV